MPRRIADRDERYISQSCSPCKITNKLGAARSRESTRYSPISATHPSRRRSPLNVRLSLCVCVGALQPGHKRVCFTHTRERLTICTRTSTYAAHRTAKRTLIIRTMETGKEERKKAEKCIEEHGTRSETRRCKKNREPRNSRKPYSRIEATIANVRGQQTWNRCKKFRREETTKVTNRRSQEHVGKLRTGKWRIKRMAMESTRTGKL